MKPPILILRMLALAITGLAPTASAAGIESIQNIVVIYAENRSFDNLYGSFSGANGLSGLAPEVKLQAKLLSSGLPARSLAPVVIVAVNVVSGVRPSAGLKVTVVPTAA